MPLIEQTVAAGGGEMQPITERVLGGVWRKGWRRFFDRAPAAERRNSPPNEAEFRGAADMTAAGIDPVALTIMAVDRIGPARLRTIFHGVPVTVAAPDERIAEIFRAALFEMAKLRPTDRLISVELAADMTTSEPSRCAK